MYLRNGHNSYSNSSNSIKLEGIPCITKYRQWNEYLPSKQFRNWDYTIYARLKRVNLAGTQIFYYTSLGVWSRRFSYNPD